MNAADAELLAEITKVAGALALKAVDLVADAHAGKVAPSDALAKLKALDDGLAANDAAADERMHEKFHPGAKL